MAEGVSEIYDDLLSNDDDKCLSSLSKIILKANNGKVITTYFSCVALNLAQTKNKTIRLLAYSLLQSFTNEDEEIWQKIIPIIFEDLNGSSKDMQIEAIKVIPHIPTSIFLEQIESGDLDLEAFHNKEHSSSVRKLTIECLQTLLLYRPLTSLNEKLAEFGWGVICNRLLDSNPYVSFEAFSSLTTLFEASESPDWFSNFNPSQFNDKFQAYIKKTAYELAIQLFPSYDQLLEKFNTLSLQLRSACVVPLSRLSCLVNINDRILLPKHNLTSAHRVSIDNLLNQFIPLLQCDNCSLIYRVGHSMLYLIDQIGYYHRLEIIFKAFTALLTQKLAPAIVLSILKCLLPVLPKLSSSRLIFAYSQIILSSTVNIHELKDRLYISTEIFNLIFKITLEKKMDVKSFEKNIPVNLLSGEWNQTKEETLLALLFSSKKFGESNNNQQSIQYIISIIKLASPALFWQQLDSFVLFHFLELIDSIASSHLKPIEPVLESLRDQFVEKFHFERAARVLFLIFKHQSWPISESIIPVMVDKFFPFVNNNNWDALRSTFIAYKQEGYLGLDIAEAAVTESCCLEIAFHCLMLMCLRGNKEISKKVKQLCKNIESAIQDPGIASRCQTIFLLIDKFSHRGKNHFDTSFLPPIELPLPNVHSAKDYFLAWKLVQAGITHFHDNQSIYPKQSKTQWIEVSGSSSPVHIEISHILSQFNSSVTFFIKITNAADIPLSNLKILITINGKMKCVSESSHQVRKIIKSLPYRKSIDWQVTCKINKFSMNSIRARCIFISELKDENGPIGITFDNFDLNSIPYSIVPPTLLLPIPLSSDEFISQWNLFPSKYILGTITNPEIPLDTLLSWFKNLEGFHTQSTVWSDEKFFQIKCSAISWFNDQLYFIVTGEFSQNQWISRFEFRGSSNNILTVFRNYLAEWLYEISASKMRPLDSDAVEDVFNFTK